MDADAERLRRLRERLVAADNLLKQAGLRPEVARRRAEEAYRQLLAEAEGAGLEALARLVRLRLADVASRDGC